MSAPLALAGPLARCPVWQSADLDEVRHEGGRVFCEHRLQIAGPGQRLDTRLHHRRLGGLGLGRLGYGATVDIDPQQLDGFYLLQWPRRGGETIRLGNQQVDSDVQTGTLVSPRQRFSMRHEAGTEKLFVRIDEAAMARQLDALLPGAGARPLVFSAAVPWADARLASLAGLLRWMFDDASGEAPLLDQPLLAAPFEEMLLRALLHGLPHDRPELLMPQPALAPGFVRRAEAWMAEHAHEPITAGQVAAAVGVSVRSLYAGFRRHREGSPMAHLRALRLDRVRAELLGTDAPAEGVTATALRWGFGHLGQFSADYRARFGELPSHTLRRTRGF
jgi:AraC-like DNA-binding protein